MTQIWMQLKRRGPGSILLMHVCQGSNVSQVLHLRHIYWSIEEGGLHITSEFSEVLQSPLENLTIDAKVEKVDIWEECLCQAAVYEKERQVCTKPQKMPVWSGFDASLFTLGSFLPDLVPDFKVHRLTSERCSCLLNLTKWFFLNMKTICGSNIFISITGQTNSCSRTPGHG